MNLNKFLSNKYKINTNIKYLKLQKTTGLIKGSETSSAVQ